jgi:hypothetical protein
MGRGRQIAGWGALLVAVSLAGAAAEGGASKTLSRATSARERRVVRAAVIHTLSPEPGFTAVGGQALDFLGLCVSGAGDVNRDGFDDILIGQFSSVPERNDKGRAYVCYGSAAGIDAATSWSVEGNETLSGFGNGVSRAGDVNRDGFDDVIVGAYSEGGNGRAYVYLGGASGLTTAPAWSDEGGHAGSQFGYSVAGAGDVNGDGFDDVIVGEPSYFGVHGGGAGRAAVYLGRASGVTSASAWAAEGAAAFEQFGWSVARAGDINHDGFDDVVVGSPRYMNPRDPLVEGRVSVFLGGASGLPTSPSTTIEFHGFQSKFGWSVASAGDVNGDGFDDVLVGAPDFTDDQDEEGRAYLYLGGASGLATSPTWTVDGNAEEVRLGMSVASAGDINRDGLADVIIGVPEYGAGRVDVFFGSTSTLAAVPDWTYEARRTLGALGRSVAPAGDINGDGLPDVIIGDPSYTDPYSNQGAAFVFLGIQVTTASRRWERYR